MRVWIFVVLLVAMLTPIESRAQVQTKDQQKCVNQQNKRFQQLASTAGKNACDCIKNFAKDKADKLGPDGTAQGCLMADVKGKVAKAKQKTSDDFVKKCTGLDKNGLSRLADFGVTDPNTVNRAALSKEIQLIRNIFGPNLDTALFSQDTNKAAAKCQQLVTKATKKCQDAKLKEFNKCKRNGLKDKDNPFDDVSDLEACMGDDPKGTIAKFCDFDDGKKVDGIRKMLDKKCRDVSLSAAFPGCGTDDPNLTHRCLETFVECRVCTALNEADGLARDCDLFDDDQANGSCTPPIGSNTCTIDDQSGFFFETSSFFDILPLAGNIEIDCGGINPATGVAPCTCTLGPTDPVPVIGLGQACLRPIPGCSGGAVDCDGGSQFNTQVTSFHNIGTCTGNADCAALCANQCGSDSVLDTGCEGFCRGGGSDGQACTVDGDCAGGVCNGLDNLPHGNICGCQCLDTTSGDPAVAGGLRCDVGVGVTVEFALPCGDGDVRFDVGEFCVPFTTELTTGIIIAADNDPNAMLPAFLGGNQVFGEPFDCTSMQSGVLTGGVLAAAANTFDVTLAGDIAFLFLLGCE